jgi:hypothetical protein
MGQEVGLTDDAIIVSKIGSYVGKSYESELKMTEKLIITDPL